MAPYSTLLYLNESANLSVGFIHSCAIELYFIVLFFSEGYTCGKCGKIFTSLSYLARHIKRVCPDMSCRKWRCTMCDKAFRHPFGLQQHIYTHTGERPHKCSQCPKAFYSSNDLRRHSRIHSGKLSRVSH